MSNPKPENRYIAAVHKHIPKTYHLKNNNPFTSGIADVFYSGVLGDLWVEYKYEEKPPRIIVPDLSDLQRRWLNNRYAEGRNVAVILGTPNGGVIYQDKQWDIPLSREAFEGIMRPKIEISQWILERVGESLWLFT